MTVSARIRPLSAFARFASTWRSEVMGGSKRRRLAQLGVFLRPALSASCRFEVPKGDWTLGAGSDPSLMGGDRWRASAMLDETVSAVKPCLRALRRDRCFPVSVFGPVLLSAFARFASAWRSEV